MDIAKNLGPNKPCPCGSGNAYKNCCLKKEIKKQNAQKKLLEIFHNQDFSEVGKLIQLGKSFLTNGEIEKCSTIMKNSETLINLIDDNEARLFFYMLVGDAYMTTDRNSEAILYYQLGLNSTREVNTDFVLSLHMVINRTIGKIYASSGNPAKAMDFLHKSIEILKEIGNEKESIDPFLDLSFEYIRARKIQDAINILDKTLPIAEKYNDVKALGRTYQQYGKRFQMDI